jgi:hypothetical protein
MTHLHDALNLERRRTHDARALARELLGAIANGEQGHPGEPCHRTYWISDQHIDWWRDRVRAWLDDLDPPPSRETTMHADQSEPRAPQLRLHSPVHYVAYGTPAGEYPSTCRAASVTQVGGWRTITDQRVAPADSDTAAEEERLGHPLARTLSQVWDAEIAALHVNNPTGVFMHECPHDETRLLGGTWHWPDNCDR